MRLAYQIKSKCAAAAAILMLTGCAQTATYRDFQFPDQGDSSLAPVSDTYVDTPAVYSDEGTPDKCLGTFSSDDGICVINRMEHYYDVTIDYENSTPAQAGKAYAEAIKKSLPDFVEIMEPYLYENIMIGVPGLQDDYTPVEERINYMSETIRPEHREELYAFAEEMSGGVRGFSEDGKLSYEEIVLFNLIPETLRGTACSALSLWGEKTATGENIAMRLLDWSPGSEYQMLKLHAVIHAKKGERSYTGISFLGFDSIVSAVNNDGVLGAILDVGSDKEVFTYNDKKCYTWELRYALEEFDTAREVGQYMVDNSADFTWSHNIFVTDKNDTFCAEDATKQLQTKHKGFSVLRDCYTPLNDSIHWDSKDSFCIVNSFAAKGNQDFFSIGENNMVRFNKYNEWVKSKDKFTVADLKTVITSEKVNQGRTDDEATVNNVRRLGTVQIIIVDYHTGNIQVSFTPATGPDDDVVFTDIGHY